MKKKLFTIGLLAMMALPVVAQNDSFFNYGNVGEGTKREGTSFGVGPSEFGINQMQTNQSLPLGSGLLLLAGSGLGYALLKKKEEVK